MEWEGREESTNVEDDRGSGRSFGGKTGLAVGGGIGGVIILILGLIFGVDFRQLGGGAGPNGGGVVQPGDGPAKPADPDEEKAAHFSKIVFKDTELVWDKLFKQMGKNYRKPVLHLYSDGVNTACGAAQSSVGPFYCPGDEKVYIDLSFYRDMQRKLNSPGDFARAYVIAHEVGHHVQHLLGYSKRAESAEHDGQRKIRSTRTAS